MFVLERFRHSFAKPTSTLANHPNTMARDKQSGRIHPHQRPTDNETPIIEGDAIDVDHAAAAHNTNSKGMKPKTCSEYRNRQQRIYVWWSTK